MALWKGRDTIRTRSDSWGIRDEGKMSRRKTWTPGCLISRSERLLIWPILSSEGLCKTEKSTGHKLGDEVTSVDGGRLVGAKLYRTVYRKKRDGQQLLGLRNWGHL